MEEVYVIKVKGTLPTTPDTSLSSREEATLGLGILHILFGSVAITMGTLGFIISSESGIEIFFGLVFVSTGLSSLLVWKYRYRKRYRKLLFVLSTVSLLSALVLLILTLVAIIRQHVIHGGPGMVASIRANVVINTILEMIVACFSTFTSANSIWNWNVFRFFKKVNPVTQKVIVTTNILLGDPNTIHNEETVRHVSPYCVISFQKNEERKEMARRLHEFVREAQCRTADGNLSSTESSVGENEMCVDMQNCCNEVLDIS